MNESANKFGLAFRRPLSRAKTFASDEGGSMYVLAMFLFVAMLIFSGLAIDFMRYELHRTRLQATLDRAILAAANPNRVISASVGQEKARKAVVMDYFKRAGLGSTIDENSITVITSQGQNIVEASAALNIKSPFLDWSGVSKLSAPASGRAEKGVALTEISLVLDVSGSMGDDNKLTNLQKAAKEFSNLLLCNPGDSSKSTDCTIPEPDLANEQYSKTSISMVPYASYVRAGHTLLQAFDPIGSHGRNDCATFSNNSFTYASVTPTPDQTALDLMSENDKRDLLLHQSSAAQIYRNVDYLSLDYYNKYKRDPYSTASAPCHRSTEDWRVITPFAHSAEVLGNRIDALQAKGSTSIDLGLKWGAALLHPEAQPVIKELSTAKPVLDADGNPKLNSDGTPMMTVPLVHETFKGRPYNPTKTTSRKIIILMTDGENYGTKQVKSPYRSGKSPFWVTRTGSKKYSYYRNRWVKSADVDVLSVFDERYGMYQWFWATSVQDGEVQSKLTAYSDHVFGTQEDDCLEGSYRKACANLGDAPSEPEHLTYEEFWGQKFYTPGFQLEHFSWTLKSNDTSIVVSISASKQDERLKAQCAAARGAGMIVVTLDMRPGVDPDAVSTHSTLLKECASVASLDGSAKQRRQYYPVKPTTIVQTFNKLANDINKLRLTK